MEDKPSMGTIDPERKKRILPMINWKLFTVVFSFCLLLFLVAWLSAWNACNNGEGDLLGWTCAEPVKLGYCIYQANTDKDYEIIVSIDDEIIENNVSVVDHPPRRPEK